MGLISGTWESFKGKYINGLKTKAKIVGIVGIVILVIITKGICLVIIVLVYI